MKRYCNSLTRYARRNSCAVRMGGVTIGAGTPVAVQTMTNTDTNDTAACVEQIRRVTGAGGRIIRLTTQGVKEGRNLGEIVPAVKEFCPDVAIVADVHFVPAVASVAAEYADKVRTNPGNYNDKGGDFTALLEQCRERGVALRVGVNHGSLSKRIMDEWGDTPQGMTASAMEFLRVCKEHDFDQVVVSMKSSNVRVMVYAYRMLAAAMAAEQMNYPIHLGVTEAGNADEGRIKSAVGIGALLADGIGDTLRVSLTEAPENEIPVGRILADYFEGRESEGCDEPDVEGFSAYEYSRRESDTVGRLGGQNVPMLWSEMTDEERDGAVIIEATGKNPVGEWRRQVLEMMAQGDRRPVVLRRHYSDVGVEELSLKAAADFGVMFIDGLADGLDIVCESVAQENIDSLALNILQASRVRISKTEYIACPGCGRTMYDLQGALEIIKSRTTHLKGLKIGVMGCIVNGLGEMADADYGYIGAGRGNISLYRGKELVKKNIPQEQAVDELIELIKADGLWKDE